MLCKNTRVDGFGISRNIVDRNKFLSRFNQFKPQEQASEVMTGRPDHPISMPEIIWPITSHIPDWKERKVHLLWLL
jgi:hypothetical protein